VCVAPEVSTFPGEKATVSHTGRLMFEVSTFPGDKATVSHTRCPRHDDANARAQLSMFWGLGALTDWVTGFR
jgi:hypothetical protein